jgi:hypothetical protein
VARLFNATIAARDPRSLAHFWSEALAYNVVQESDLLARIAPPAGVGGPNLLVLQVPEPSVPTAKIMHWDLAAIDVRDEVERLVSLGASLVDERVGDDLPWREANGIQWIVLRDPERNEFCVGSEPGD